MTGQRERTYRKLTISASTEVHDVLAWMKVEMDAGTITEVIKRSVALMRFVLEHKDCDLLIRHPDGETEKVVLV